MSVSARRQRTSFYGFQVGSVFAGLLIAIGTERLLTTATWPLATLVTGFVNYLIRTGRFQMSTLTPQIRPWFLMGAETVAGVIMLLCGLRLGAWLGPDNKQG
jgi:hypothetical protein